MRIAITGASGFVGTALSQRLAREHQVVALHRGPAPTNSGRLTHISVDYQQPASLVAALQGCDALIHLIAKTHSRDSEIDLPAYRAINVELSKTIARAAAAAGVKRFVFLSSIKVNGEQTHSHPFDHHSLPQPTSAYGQSKLEAELALETLCRQQGMELTIVRPPLIYAPDAKGNIQSLRRALEKGLPLPLGGIHNRRHLIDLPLLCELLERCCTLPAAAGQTLLAANAHALSTPAMVKKLASDLQLKPRLIHIPQSWLELAGKLTGRSEAIGKLCGNLEVDASHTRRLLQLNTTT